jgi:hypothetical protein
VVGGADSDLIDGGQYVCARSRWVRASPE